MRTNQPDPLTMITGIPSLSVIALLATRATITEEVAEEDFATQNVKLIFFDDRDMMVVCSDRKIVFKVIVLTFSLDESRDDDTKHQAKDRVGQVGVVQEAGGQV